MQALLDGFIRDERNIGLGVVLGSTTASLLSASVTEEFAAIYTCHGVYDPRMCLTVDPSTCDSDEYVAAQCPTLCGKCTPLTTSGTSTTVTVTTATSRTATTSTATITATSTTTTKTPSVTATGTTDTDTVTTSTFTASTTTTTTTFNGYVLTHSGGSDGTRFSNAKNLGFAIVTLVLDSLDDLQDCRDACTALEACVGFYVFPKGGTKHKCRIMKDVGEENGVSTAEADFSYTKLRL
jgi:hypothetical protein